MVKLYVWGVVVVLAVWAVLLVTKAPPPPAPPPCQPAKGEMATQYWENGALQCEKHEIYDFGSGAKKPGARYPAWVRMNRRI